MVDALLTQTGDISSYKTNPWKYCLTADDHARQVK